MKTIKTTTEEKNTQSSSIAASPKNAYTKPDPFFAEPSDPVREGREQGIEVIRHLLIWLADAPTLEKRGLRATVALHCIRPDLINGVTLEHIGDKAGCTRQSIHKRARDFRVSMGLTQ